MSTVNKNAEIGPPQVSLTISSSSYYARISSISQVLTKLFMKGLDGRNPASITY
ncbi:MAG: hypothetical protein QN720_03885 [Nitrososphaeraceae archaeon]|nr:hypothetical protein [Nitrososphaeraceae archaeon]MDW0332074.1 hypothetical protein [Nitrososphaeraceae archaeon]